MPPIKKGPAVSFGAFPLARTFARITARQAPVAEKTNPEKAPPPPPSGGRWATPEEIQAFLTRARRVLFLYYMPVASKWVH
jgi:hypothetical protein